MQNDSLRIRRANAGDIPAVLNLLSQVLAVHAQGRPDIFKSNVTKYGDNELKEIFADEKKPVFVAEINDAVAGYAFCQLQRIENSSVLKPVKTLYIDDLCVDENLRGHKTGTALFEAVKSFAKSQNCHNITLNVWSFNTPALKFYESLGMKPQREYKEYIL
ncbi:MAG: GNAT family N-acetyltransferase [Clostridia bacterium]|nr:GNAT family N-acetyltransferase [Clostridia bacterium]